jgi:hypothetical protein
MFKPKRDGAEASRDLLGRIQTLSDQFSKAGGLQGVYDRVADKSEATDAEILMAAIYMLLPHLKQYIDTMQSGKVSDSCGLPHEMVVEANEKLKAAYGGDEASIRGAAKMIVDEFIRTIWLMSEMILASMPLGGSIITRDSETEEADNAIH